MCVYKSTHAGIHVYAVCSDTDTCIHNALRYEACHVYINTVWCVEEGAYAGMRCLHY